MATRMLRISNNSRVISVFREIDAQWVVEVRVLFVRMLLGSNPRPCDRTVRRPMAEMRPARLFRSVAFLGPLPPAAQP